MERKKTTLIVFYDDETKDQPVLRPLTDVLNQFFDAGSGVPKFKQVGNIDVNDASTWVMAACKADYTRGSFLSLNHYIPVYPRGKLGDFWDSEVSKLMAKVDKRIQSCKKRILQMQEEESDDEFVASVLVQQSLWENKLCFYKTLLSMSLLPCDVPADGSCALWSLDALKSGPFSKTCLSTPDTIAGLRQEHMNPEL